MSRTRFLPGGLSLELLTLPGTCSAAAAVMMGAGAGGWHAHRAAATPRGERARCPRSHRTPHGARPGEWGSGGDFGVASEQSEAGAACPVLRFSAGPPDFEQLGLGAVKPLAGSPHPP